MGIFENWPYTNYHDLNLNWVIGKIKDAEAARDEMLQVEADTIQARDDASGYRDEALQFRNDAEDYKDAASGFADDAEADAILSKGYKDDAANIVDTTVNMINLLQSRVDNIIPDGTQTAGNTELLDIRVGYDSIIYDSAGNAVRGQVSDLHDDINELHTKFGYISSSKNLVDMTAFEDGYYSSGVWTASTTYETGEYIYIDDAVNVYVHMFNLNNGTLQDTTKTFEYLYWFDQYKTYQDRTLFVAGTTSYPVPAGAKYVRAMGKTATIDTNLNNNKGYYLGTEDTSVWIDFYPGGYPDYYVSLTSDIYEIETPKASYIFKKVTDVNKNLDTWRLYEGNLKNNSGTFNMWNNSDAEGAIKITGETDFVSGYHGSEIATAIKVFLDGVDVTNQSTINTTRFRTLDFYVESDVYHCYQDPDANIVAFKRSKIVSFADDKVTVCNSYIAQDNLSIAGARIALFQCYKEDPDNNPVFTDFSVNTDFKNYTVADVANTRPAASNKMTEAVLHTTYSNICFKLLQTSGQNYQGTLQNFPLQNRIKFYFDTIASTTSVSNGEQIMSSFDFEIK